ncbi:S9 family peptidase [Aliidiomarina sedimenti]|uniref:prolyl oligopeptidase n=1 Tax=Aliidiomarina sedimenti TaxID=1933879 RepID=A0ABY0C1C0_9GAMM|nr:prolyl oligopeptidase family serine peptidase [Aliidiomarina sedimenti]RUO31578.1 S9 family peptidase [Aliidiomarina sedimenti]
MKKPLLTLIAAAVLSACSPASDNASENATESGAETSATQQQDQALDYPQTRRDDTVDTYFGQDVADPFRWLEDDRSDETAAWVEAQNELTFDYLGQIDFRDQVRERLADAWNYERLGAPFEEGDYTYFYRNDGLQNHFVVYRQQGDGEPEVFLDPNEFSEDGTTSLAGLSFSPDGSLAAYATSAGGSDWRTIYIIDAETKEPIGEPLVDVKFSGISWRENDGIYYSKYDSPDGSRLSQLTDQHKLYYHELNTSQADDPVIFGGSDEQKHRYVGGRVTDDGRFLAITAANTTSGNKLFVMDLQADEPELVTVVGHEDSNTGLLTNDGDYLLLQTNLDAPNNRLVRVNASEPDSANWQDLIAEEDEVLSVSRGAGYIFASYMVDAVSKVKQFSMDGEEIREIDLPGVGSAGGFSGKDDADKIYFSFTNYITPPSTFSLDPESGDAELYFAAETTFDPENYVSEQVFYTSKDGTRIPMIISYRKDLQRDGSNPTMLYGYGGFNVSLTPSFSVTNAVWMDLGGIYAVPNIRGGGEYGQAWHQAGIRTSKQNVFDDFIAAAEYLVEEDYTSADKLALRGGSNGGLLVGAVMTQRPDLAKVALPAVGVLDMLRYHTFTAGAGWAYDYGTAEQSEEMFQYLHGYSPLHNVEEGVNYPATMITTADHDDRVVPAHSFKFAAELQSKDGGENPQLIRIDVNAGHGAGMPTSMIIDQAADVLSFTLYNMGYEKLD